MIWIILAIVAGVVVAFIVAAVIGAITRAVGRGSPVAADLARRSRRPLRAALMVIGVWLGLRLATDSSPWVVDVEHVMLILLIATTAWLIGTLAFVAEDAAFLRFRIDVPDNRHARRVRTQIVVMRRLTVVILVLGAIAAALLTFPAARAFGTGLIASAGLISIVAGLAAQSSLANLFAGLQLAFTDAIRVDDVVVVDNQWGRIEELTLTYVVVHVWDDRRLILPSTHFTTTPFENWTRRASDLLGTVELDLDWAVPVAAMRAELVRLLTVTDLWDHRVGILQVTEATGGLVRVRALASAPDAPTLFDLRCYVREGLVAWVQRTAPDALPRTRLETVETAAPVAAAAPTVTSYGELAMTPPLGTGEQVTRRSARAAVQPDAPRPGDTQRLELGAQDSRLFTGSIDAIERSRAFAGPGVEAIAEREHAVREWDTWGGGPSGPVTVVGPPVSSATPVEAAPNRASSAPASPVSALPDSAPSDPQMPATETPAGGEPPADETRDVRRD
ncbi:MAG: mechanosensitive ion channel [Cellulomonas sp.]|uniref:mechanosensitive ion channel family protein n=1 Tax=Cellulomonas sp. TaxID=40001 RepID=UPI00182EA166|nr:mechanosensitive ion channel domain-containing protein [Cellulomonas sp.]NMM29727.1 mechanosensitive ion channel [Cellulomonas sp.]